MIHTAMYCARLIPAETAASNVIICYDMSHDYEPSSRVAVSDTLRCHGNGMHVHY